MGVAVWGELCGVSYVGGCVGELCVGEPCVWELCVGNCGGSCVWVAVWGGAVWGMTNL